MCNLCSASSKSHLAGIISIAWYNMRLDVTYGRWKSIQCSHLINLIWEIQGGLHRHCHEPLLNLPYLLCFPPSLPFLGKYSFHTSVCRQMPGNGLWLGCHGDLLRRLLPSSLTTFRAPTLQYYWQSVLTTANEEKQQQQQQQQQKKASCWWASRVCHLLLKNKWLH